MRGGEYKASQLRQHPESSRWLSGTTAPVDGVRGKPKGKMAASALVRRNDWYGLLFLDPFHDEQQFTLRGAFASRRELTGPRLRLVRRELRRQA